ncbi:MAG TPA: hypothetical protein PKZ67_08915 [Accumulibacter sp.]|uniref:Uncharacterized protein n=2 Tax=Candidatus Accumulibacter TaxID=327159 RepID=A0A080M674_9PROT|nr:MULTISPECIES: hypothetical protein [Candidatus Accumulibacter]KFB76802.1 MAG: hypothetical protein AW06_002072 [Candidatus Accumulibacter cognatus]MBN8517796.1 hypothetical protein [Accumulibacter sp.]MBO3711127.1 hypothetical protein [Accumulibacter sp.]MCC2868439.1 hypothetical protein [Candidatus Accumulibacter phosphatis]MCM8577988.1 hypothetical protein [Accumulibacter sp.]
MITSPQPTTGPGPTAGAELPGLLLRNVFFNVFFFFLVLMHGLRRLLPPY